MDEVREIPEGDGTEDALDQAFGELREIRIRLYNIDQDIARIKSHIIKRDEFVYGELKKIRSRLYDLED
ncbi:MAG: hypothetical protein KAW09_06340 [Thermoplasmata archaeon]|nr:hypothetical protein [Thermoplasmata archaeon]